MLLTFLNRKTGFLVIFRCKKRHKPESWVLFRVFLQDQTKFSCSRLKRGRNVPVESCF